MDGPADTRGMAIVHGALRRDLARAHAALIAVPHPRDRQREAIGEHVTWLMEFLHDHHDGEDNGLWPLVRRRNPAAGALLDDMDADHRRIEPAMAATANAAREYAASAVDRARSGLATAIDLLNAVLEPHLDREVAETMPVVSASITQREWHEWEQVYNIRPRSFMQLGAIGHWLLDGIDPDGYDLVVHQVPAIPRFILLHGFARRYRRGAAIRWQPAPRAERETRRDAAPQTSAGD
jgi:hypothetical protein